MHVLLYSTVFWPQLGGIETVTDVLAAQLVALGHRCTVVTETPLAGQSELVRPYVIVRMPGRRRRLTLVKGADVVHANGAMLALYPYAVLAGVPFVWTHNGYQVSCVDGLGWSHGAAAPMTPRASLAHHRPHLGWHAWARAAIKLALRRHVARHVDLNLAGSQWVAQRQPLPRQVVAYNPYPLGRFRAAGATRAQPTVDSCDFGYVGRLVGEKGVATLIQALHKLVTTTPHRQARLAIVGGGELRADLELQARKLGLGSNVVFHGPRQSDELVALMAGCDIGIVPSTWEEPYGGVTLEWLATGRGVIVSEQGGHAECAGDAGLRFANGDVDTLCACMQRLLDDPDLREQLRRAAAVQVEAFDEVALTRHYVAMYERARAARRQPRLAPA
jgi:glycosyltransferase involved in cell wall biosynthesis